MTFPLYSPIGTRGAGAADGSSLGSIQVMQVVRDAGSRFLRSWVWPSTSSVMVRAPAATIHMGTQDLQDAAARQEVEKAAPAPTPTPAPSRSSFSIYPPVPGQESSLRWAGRAFQEIPIAHIKASYNKLPPRLGKPAPVSVMSIRISWRRALRWACRVGETRLPANGVKGAPTCELAAGASRT
ncbi:small ribosomal subunit protein uS11m isoform 2-T2 [Glossophaga mutica]